MLRFDDYGLKAKIRMASDKKGPISDPVLFF